MFKYKANSVAARRKVEALYIGYASTPYGDMLCAYDDVGLVYTGFQSTDGMGWKRAFTTLRRLFPVADILTVSAVGQDVVRGMQGDAPLTLHVYGTPFQHKVWRALLGIKSGQTQSYGQVAATVGDANACRAVGTAVGSNPISLIIPCHRVLHSGGHNRNYGWGVELKATMLAQECGADASYKTVNAKAVSVA